jgi:proteasome lid subunit RPN8/RPN11
VVIPDDVRAALVAHAEREAPNEACGLLLIRDDVVDRYVAARNKAASPYRFELELDPLVWDQLNDEYENQGIFHSHISSPPRPSRTDVENIGLWERKPYVILSLRTGDLAAFEIADGQITEVAITTSR